MSTSTAPFRRQFRWELKPIFCPKETARSPPKKEIWQKFMGGLRDQQPEFYRLVSPLAHLDKTDPPTWLTTGEKDDPSTHGDELRQKM